MKKALFIAASVAISSLASAQNCSDLFISEYVEGTGNNKAIEFYNPTATPINLSGYKFIRYSNGSFTGTDSTSLVGTVPAYGTFVLVNGQKTSDANSPACDLVLQALSNQLDGAYPAPTYVNGDDALVLRKGGVVLDIFGKIGEDPGSAWSDPADASNRWWTANHTLRRKAGVNKGVSTNPIAFNVTTEWDSLPNNSWANLGQHNCVCGNAGIQDISAPQASIFPNPSTDGNFTVVAPINISKASIYNSLGQLVTVIANEIPSKNLTVKNNTLPVGLYVVAVQYAANNQVTTTKFIVK